MDNMKDIETLYAAAAGMLRQNRGDTAVMFYSSGGCLGKESRKETDMDLYIEIMGREPVKTIEGLTDKMKCNPADERETSATSGYTVQKS